MNDSYLLRHVYLYPVKLGRSARFPWAGQWRAARLRHIRKVQRAAQVCYLIDN